jgi:hypothetical protein
MFNFRGMLNISVQRASIASNAIVKSPAQKVDADRYVVLTASPLTIDWLVEMIQLTDSPFIKIY